MLGYQTSSYVLGVIPKMVYLFGTVFKDLHIPRTDANGALQQLISVPIIYGPKDKVLERVTADPNLDRKPAVQLPMLSFEHVDTVYDSSRKLSSLNKISVEDVKTDTLKNQFTPVPFNFMFDLHCYAKTNVDLNNMLEQILPFFTPEFTVRAVLIPDIQKTWDIPIVYVSQEKVDEYQGKVEDRRLLHSTLHFAVKGYLFGPIISQPVIKFANVNFYVPDTNTAAEGVGITTPIDRVTVQPGLTVNGLPTSNIAQTVPIANITANSNYGYITTVYGILNANSP